MHKLSAVRAAGIAVAVAALSACTSISLPTASALRALNLLDDDVADLVLALDLPDTLAPIPDGFVLTIVASVPDIGERRLEAVLVHAETDAIAGTLPPPDRDRAYYVFGFSPEDRAAVAELQQWGRAIPGGFSAAGGTLTIGAAPGICATADIDPATTKFSVLVALPGGDRLQPLVDHARLADLVARTGAPSVPDCSDL